MEQELHAPLRLAGAWDTQPTFGRWRHLLKQAAFFCYLYCGWVPLRDAVLWILGRSHVVIVYYHRIGWVDFLSKPMREFRRDVSYLSRNYRCMTVGQLADLLASGEPIRGKVAVITFDDGYRDNCLAALPVLENAGVPATFFVSTGYIGTARTFPHDQRALARGQSVREDWEKLTWDDLRRMQDAGMEIGSHTVDHTDMGTRDRALIRRELTQSLADLQRELGQRVRPFCFPWGKEANMSAEALEEIRAAGYRAAVTTLPGFVRNGDDVLRLRRIDTGNGHMSSLCTRAMIEGMGCGWLARYLRK